MTVQPGPSTQKRKRRTTIRLYFTIEKVLTLIFHCLYHSVSTEGALILLLVRTRLGFSNDRSQRQEHNPQTTSQTKQSMSTVTLQRRHSRHRVRGVG